MHALTFSLPYSFAASQGFYFCLIWINKDVCEENGATSPREVSRKKSFLPFGVRDGCFNLFMAQAAKQSYFRGLLMTFQWKLAMEWLKTSGLLGFTRFARLL